MKKPAIKVISIIILLIISISSLHAQEKPFRIGVKAGFPNIITGNLEFVTPLADKKLSLMVDYSAVSVSVEEIVLDYSYFEIGMNYYLRREGHGPYVALSYTNMSLDLTYDNLESEDDPNLLGTATAGIGMNTLNLKLGAKWGGLIYFRPEIGFSFTPLPNTVDIEVNFPDGSFEAQVEEVPSVLTGGFIFNIGFGFSF